MFVLVNQIGIEIITPASLMSWIASTLIFLIPLPSQHSLAARSASLRARLIWDKSSCCFALLLCVNTRGAAVAYIMVAASPSAYTYNVLLSRPAAFVRPSSFRLHHPPRYHLCLDSNSGTFSCQKTEETS